MNVISIGILFCTAPSIPSTRTSKNGKYVARDMFEYLCQQQYVSVYNIINKIKILLILFAFYHSLYLRLLMETPANTDYSCHDIAHKKCKLSLCPVGSNQSSLCYDTGSITTFYR